MDSSFTNDVKNMICEIYVIIKKNPTYIQASRARKRKDAGLQLSMKNLDKLLQQGQIDEK